MIKRTYLTLSLTLLLFAVLVLSGCGGGSGGGGVSTNSSNATTAVVASDASTTVSTGAVSSVPAASELLAGTQGTGTTDCNSCHASVGSSVQVLKAVAKGYYSDDGTNNNANGATGKPNPHLNVNASPNFSDFTDDTCTKCHDPFSDGKKIQDFYLSSGSTKYGKTNRPIVGCEACHGGGGNHKGVGAIPVEAPNAIRCGRCHNSAMPSIAAHNNAPEGKGIIEAYVKSKHATSIESHNLVNGSSTDVLAICSRCHTDEGARKYISLDNGTEDKTTFDNNITNAGVADIANANRVQCRTCHDKHNPSLLLGDSAKYAVGAWNGTAWSSQFKTCNACHQLLKDDNNNTLNDKAHHAPKDATGAVVNKYGSTSDIITDTHYDDATTGNIEGYIIDPTATHSDSAGNNNKGACLDCHNPHNADITINLQWAQSAHGGKITTVKDATNGAAPYYGAVTETQTAAWVHYDFKHQDANPLLDRSACQRCHTSTGFRNYANNTATYTPAMNVAAGTGFVATGSQKELLYCWACHYNNVGGLRDPGAITAGYNFNGAAATFPNVGGSNICIACHMGRESGESLNSVADFTNNSFVNSHYLAAAGLMYVKDGFTGFVDPNTAIGTTTYGKSLTSTDDGGTISSTHRKLGTSAINGDTHNTAVFTAGNFDSNGPCVTCHMQATGQSARNDHTWAINASAYNQVCKNCHTSEGTTALTGDNFLTVFVEPQSEVFQNALKLALSILQTKYNISYNSASYPYFYDLAKDPTGKTAVKDWTRGTNDQAFGKKMMGACFNINLLNRESAAFVHARTYARRLLYDTIDFLDDGTINLSVGATAIATDPTHYGKGATAYTDGTLTTLATGTTESMVYIIGWSRSTGKWSSPERP